MTKLYTFNELVECSWDMVIGKKFKRIDTNQCLGKIYAKYPKHCGKLSALMNNGRIEFMNQLSNADENPIMTVLFGCDLPEEMKLFIME